MTKENPIEQFFRERDKIGSKYSELFKGNDDFIDQMTELTDEDIRNILALQATDNYLEKLQIQPVFEYYVHHFMRLMVSRARKSREEYVKVHSAEELKEVVGHRPSLP